ncbi:MAG TPA: helix-turn-helix domain-containing protein [Naasia sp.]|jgi:AcrR family transcriptional regulator
MADPILDSSPGPRRGRLQRGTLTRALVVSAALELLDDEGADGLTFSKLGAKLGASSTAVYRHFSSRNDIMRAVGDELDRQALDGYEPSEDWVESLRDLAWRAWHTAVRHPAAAASALYMITGGMNELRAVDAVLEAIHRAGWRGRDAVLQYQSFANFVLAMSAANAQKIVQLTDQDGLWIQEYRPLDPSMYPYAEAVKGELRRLDLDEVFRQQVETLLAEMRRSAPDQSAPEQPAPA